MRDPAIHIKRSRLAKILLDYGITKLDVDKIMTEAAKISIRNRVVMTLPAKARVKAKRIAEATTDLVDIFNQCYVTVMTESKIKVLVIHKGDTQYLTLKEITRQAKEFCELFEWDYTQGFLVYLRTAVKLLGNKYSLYRLKGAADLIVTNYRSVVEINQDEDPIGTGILREAWDAAVKTYFGVSILIGDHDVNKLVHFVYARRDADSLKASYEDWMNAQFEKWSFLNSMPAFSQLHGDNAKINYQIYMTKHVEDKKVSKEKQFLKDLADSKEKERKAKNDNNN
jgi:hypothetical protein